MENQNNNGFNNNNNNHNGSSLDGTEIRYGNLYHVIDAFIDTLNQPQNRKNAIKFGIRAIGELVSEFPREKANGHATMEQQHAEPEHHEEYHYEVPHAKSDPNAPQYGSKY